ncbi:MAG: MFS transporter [Anaerolineae bacterium]|nr:MFS transporter [Anaerolineae bacterium]
MTRQRPSERPSFLSTLQRPIVVLLLLQLMAGMILSPSRTFLPVYVKELGYSAILISTLATISQIAGLAASLAGGTLSDTLGRKGTLLLGNVGYLLTSLIFFTPSIGAIGVLWAIGGFAMGLHTLGGESYLMDTAHPNYLGVLAALYNWGYTLGGALSSPVAGFVLDRWSYDVFGAVLLTFALGTVLANAFALPRSPVEGRARSVARQRWFGYREIATRPPVWMLSVLRFLPTFYYGMSNILIPLLLYAAGASKMVIALYATVGQVAASLAQVVVGRQADRYGPKWPTVVTFGALVVGIVGVGALTSSLWGVFAFGALGLAAAWSLSTLLPSLVAEVTAPEERGRVLGWIHLWWNLAMSMGAMAGGAMYEVAVALPFGISAVLNVIAIALVFVFHRMMRASQVASNAGLSDR